MDGDIGGVAAGEGDREVASKVPYRGPTRERVIRLVIVTKDSQGREWEEEFNFPDGRVCIHHTRMNRNAGPGGDYTNGIEFVEHEIFWTEPLAIFDNPKGGRPRKDK